MARVSMKVNAQEVKILTKDMARMNKALVVMGEETIKQFAEDTRRYARQHAPRDTGRLASQISVKKTKDGYTVYSSATSRPKGDQRYRGFPYARVQEIGYSKTRHPRHEEYMTFKGKEGWVRTKSVGPIPSSRYMTKGLQQTLASWEKAIDYYFNKEVKSKFK